MAHKCHRCEPLEGPIPNSADDTPVELDSIEATFSTAGDEITFVSGYGAREIALRSSRESGRKVYVNNVSRKIRRQDLTVSVAFGVAQGEIFTIRPPDSDHPAVFRSYWRPLE